MGDGDDAGEVMDPQPAMAHVHAVSEQVQIGVVVSAAMMCVMKLSDQVVVLAVVCCMLCRRLEKAGGHGN